MKKIIVSYDSQSIDICKEPLCYPNKAYFVLLFYPTYVEPGTNINIVWRVTNDYGYSITQCEVQWRYVGESTYTHIETANVIGENWMVNFLSPSEITTIQFRIKAVINAEAFYSDGNYI